MDLFNIPQNCMTQQNIFIANYVIKYEYLWIKGYLITFFKHQAVKHLASFSIIAGQEYLVQDEEIVPIQLKHKVN